MKKLFILFVSSAFLFSCTSKKEMHVTVENPGKFNRVASMVEIPLDSVKSKVALTGDEAYLVKNEAGDIVPSQITYDGLLIFQTELKADESKKYIITGGKKQNYEPKTHGRFVPERKDDFAWENDRVAFRIYGPALIAVDGPSNGIDLWYKRTNDLIIDKWYKDDLSGKASYHTDHGEGLDDYKVGQSLGGGGMAPYVDDKLWLNENFASQEVFENGPLRTTFKLTYKNLDVKGTSIPETRTISIDAGSQLYKITQNFDVEEPMPVAAGLVKREKNDSIVSTDQYIVYAEPKMKLSDNAYLALVFPQGIDKTIIDTYIKENVKTKKSDTYSHVLAITMQKPGVPTTYYTGYGWSKFGFPTLSDFVDYVKAFTEGLNEPLVIKYK